MLLQKVLMTDPAGAVNLALQIGQMTPPPMDFNYIADLFLQVNCAGHARRACAESKSPLSPPGTL
jgi:hypothetical protein